MAVPAQAKERNFRYHISEYRTSDSCPKTMQTTRARCITPASIFSRLFGSGSVPAIVVITFSSSYALMRLLFSHFSLNRTDPITFSYRNEHNLGRLGVAKEHSSAIVHLVAVADENFARKYKPLFFESENYCNFHKYKWHVISGENIELCSNRHEDFFFRKHCIVAEWMGNSLNENDVVFVFDSDVVPFRFDETLENWAYHDEDIIFYERIWNTEIMAGNYIVRNNQRARTFLRGWADFEYEKPTGFSSADNGAIHLHIRRVVGLEDKEQGYCGQLYRNLTASSDNLDPYYEFVECARQNVTVGKFGSTDGSGLKLRLLGKAQAWAVDGVYDPFKPDEFGPVFHHGVKPPFADDVIKKYGLNLTLYNEAINSSEHSKATQSGPVSVLCGRHSAPFCSMCAINLTTGEWVGEAWCNGQCTWINSACVLRE